MIAIVDQQLGRLKVAPMSYASRKIRLCTVRLQIRRPAKGSSIKDVRIGGGGGGWQMWTPVLILPVKGQM